MVERKEKTEAEKERAGGQRGYVLSRLGLESDSSHAPGAFSITTFRVIVRPAGVIGAARCFSRKQTLFVVRRARRRFSLSRPAATAFGSFVITTATYIFS